MPGESRLLGAVGINLAVFKPHIGMASFPIRCGYKIKAGKIRYNTEKFGTVIGIEDKRGEPLWC
jgi:hypothetical protein